VHEMRLGGPATLAPVGRLHQVDELGHVVVGSLAQDGSGVRGGGGALCGHEEILPVSCSTASSPCPSGAARVRRARAGCRGGSRGGREPWGSSCSGAVS